MNKKQHKRLTDALKEIQEGIKFLYELALSLEFKAPKDAEVDEDETDEDDEEETPPKSTKKGKKAKVEEEDDEEDESEEDADDAGEEDEENEEDESEDEDDSDDDVGTAKKKAKKLKANDVQDACKAYGASLIESGKMTGPNARKAVLKILEKKFGVESVTDLKPAQFADAIKALKVK